MDDSFSNGFGGFSGGFSGSRYKPKSPGLDLNDPEVLKAISDKLGLKKEKPQANLLERALGLLSGIGSVPDAILRTQKGEGNGNFFQNYWDNISQGAKTTFLGEKAERELKGTADLLEQNNILRGDDWGSKGARGLLGFVGDVALDPTTYVTFGAGGLAKTAGQTALKAGTKALAKEGGEVLLKEGAEALAKKGAQELAEKGAQKTGMQLLENLGKEGAESVGKAATKANTFKNVVLGEGDDYLKLFGKDLTNNQYLVNAAKLAFNPLGTLGGAAFRGSKVLAPELTQGIEDTFNKAFRAGKYEESKGLGGLFNRVKDFTKQLDNLPENVLTKEGELISKLKNLPKEVSENFANYIEGTQKFDLEKLSKEAQQQLAKNKIDVPELIQRVTNKNDEFGKALREAGVLGTKNADTGLDLFSQGIEKDVPYFARQVAGFKPEFLATKFGPEDSARILADSAVAREIKKNGFVTKETLNKVIDGNPALGGLSAKGLRNPEKYLGDAANERVFKTLQEGENAGVIYNKNAAELFATGAVRTSKVEAATTFAKDLENITDDAGNKLFAKSTGGEIPAGFKEFEIPNVGKFVAPNEAVDVLKNYSKEFFGDQGTQNLVKAYDKFLGFFKATVTGKGPGVIGFNVRNAIGDFQNMVLGGFRWNKAGEAFGAAGKAVAFRKLALKEGIEAAEKKFGPEVKELYENAIKFGMIGSDQLEDALGKGSADLMRPSLTQSFGRKVGDVTDKIFMTGLQRDRENLFRMANIYDHFKQTGSWAEAAKKARLSSLDYDNLTPFEKNVMKRVLPFYSFMRQNMEQKMNLLFKNPQMLQKNEYFFRNLNEALGTNDMTEEDWAALPDWMKTGARLVLKKDGSNVSVLTGWGDTVQAVDDIFAGSPEQTLKNLAKSSSPLLKAGIEKTTGQDLFYGDTIKGRQPGERYSQLPEPLKQYLDYREVERERKDKATGKMVKYKDITIDGEKLWQLNQIPSVSPILTQAKRVTDAKSGVESGNYASLLNLFSGGRVYDKDINVEAERRKKEEAEALMEVLYDQGIIKKYTSTYLPKEEKPALLAGLN